MSHSSDTPPARRTLATAKKLLQAAAFAATLVPLGSVVSEAAIITCDSTASGGGGCGSGGFASYTASGGVESNTWKFFFFGDLKYTIEIEGNATSDFTLRVEDFVTTQTALTGGGSLANFPNDVCLPTFGPSFCGLFDVTVFNGPASWDTQGYLMTITWFTNSDLLSQPPDDGLNRILQAKDQFGGTIFSNPLLDNDYDPAPTPTDPALGGRGDSFSRFGAFRTASVPEPSVLLLLGAGLATAVARRRRRQG
jgi:hypothetical protein